MASLISKIEAHMKTAYSYAELSKCERLKVGAVLIKDDRPISVGYNGTPTDGPNDCEKHEYVDNLHMKITRPEVIHAEKNCIAFAARHGTSTLGCTLVLTHSPCIDCATLIIQAGIKEIWYDQEYRETDPIKFLESYKIKVRRLSDEKSR